MQTAKCGSRSGKCLGYLLCLSGILLLLACPARPKPSVSAPKAEVPDFSLPALDGSTVSLSSFKGRPIVLDFWASWCGPCQKSMPALVGLYGKYKDKVAFLGIAMNDKQEDAQKAASENGVAYPILIGNNDVAQAYHIEAIPTMYILDAKGGVAYKETGFDPDSGAVRMERVIKKLVGKR